MPDTALATVLTAWSHEGSGARAGIYATHHLATFVDLAAEQDLQASRDPVTVDHERITLTAGHATHELVMRQTTDGRGWLVAAIGPDVS